MANDNAFAAFLDSLFQEDWVVYAKPPFGGPEHVLHYLARYTHRVAISNHRILAVNESQVIFRWKDYAHHNKQRTMPLTCEEFLHRFLQHVLPKGFPRIRYFGWLANRRRNKLLPVCRDLLPPVTQQASAEPADALWLCPRCHGPMAVLERLTAVQFSTRKGGTNASLIVPRRTSLAISADLSIHPLEVCPAALKTLSLRTGDSFWSTSPINQCLFSALFDLRHPHLSVALQPKNGIENT